MLWKHFNSVLLESISSKVNPRKEYVNYFKVTEHCKRFTVNAGYGVWNAPPEQCLIKMD